MLHELASHHEEKDAVKQETIDVIPPSNIFFYYMQVCSFCPKADRSPACDERI